MERLNMLREQAKLLRDLSEQAINGEKVRPQLLALAKRCDELAIEHDQLLAKVEKLWDDA